MRNQLLDTPGLSMQLNLPCCTQLLFGDALQIRSDEVPESMHLGTGYGLKIQAGMIRET